MAITDSLCSGASRTRTGDSWVRSRPRPSVGIQRVSRRYELLVLYMSAAELSGLATKGVQTEPTLVQRGPRGTHRSGAAAFVLLPQTVWRWTTSYFLTEERLPGVSSVGIAFRASSPCR